MSLYCLDQSSLSKVCDELVNSLGEASSLLNQAPLPECGRTVTVIRKFTGVGRKITAN